MQQLFVKNKKKLILGCTFNVQIEFKKNLQLLDLSFNIWFNKSKCRYIKNFCCSNFFNYQLKIDYFEKIFFDNLEIFLAAVFLFIMPILATCIRID